MPRDGERLAPARSLVGGKQRSAPPGVPAFTDADHAGANELPWRGAQTGKWLGALWMPGSGPTGDAGNMCACHRYRRAAVANVTGRAF